MDKRGTFGVVHVLLIPLGTRLGPVEAVGVGSSILLHQNLQRHLSFREREKEIHVNKHILCALPLPSLLWQWVKVSRDSAKNAGKHIARGNHTPL